MRGRRRRAMRLLSSGRRGYRPLSGGSVRGYHGARYPFSDEQAYLRSTRGRFRAAVRGLTRRAFGR